MRYLELFEKFIPRNKEKLKNYVILDTSNFNTKNKKFPKSLIIAKLQNISLEDLKLNRGKSFLKNFEFITINILYSLDNNNIKKEEEEIKIKLPIFYVETSILYQSDSLVDCKKNLPLLSNTLKYNL